MRIPQRVVDIQQMPSIKVEKLTDQNGYKASCPALPAVEPVTNDSQTIAGQLMLKRVHDHVTQGTTSRKNDAGRS